MVLQFWIVYPFILLVIVVFNNMSMTYSYVLSVLINFDVLIIILKFCKAHKWCACMHVYEQV